VKTSSPLLYQSRERLSGSVEVPPEELLEEPPEVSLEVSPEVSVLVTGGGGTGELQTSPSAHGDVVEEQVIPGRSPAVHVPLMQYDMSVQVLFRRQGMLTIPAVRHSLTRCSPDPVGLEMSVDRHVSVSAQFVLSLHSVPLLCNVVVLV